MVGPPLQSFLALYIPPEKNTKNPHLYTWPESGLAGESPVRHAMALVFESRRSSKHRFSAGDSVGRVTSLRVGIAVKGMGVGRGMVVGRGMGVGRCMGVGRRVGAWVAGNNKTSLCSHDYMHAHVCYQQGWIQEFEIAKSYVHSKSKGGGGGGGGFRGCFSRIKGGGDAHPLHPTPPPHAPWIQPCEYEQVKYRFLVCLCVLFYFVGIA